MSTPPTRTEQFYQVLRQRHGSRLDGCILPPPSFLSMQGEVLAFDEGAGVDIGSAFVPQVADACRQGGDGVAIGGAVGAGFGAGFAQHRDLVRVQQLVQVHRQASRGGYRLAHARCTRNKGLPDVRKPPIAGRVRR